MFINYAYAGFLREQLGIGTIKNINQFICGLFNESLPQTVLRSGVRILQKPRNHCKILGTAVAQWLRCCATNRKVAGSIPAGVIDIKSFLSH